MSETVCHCWTTRRYTKSIHRLICTLMYCCQNATDLKKLQCLSKTNQFSSNVKCRSPWIMKILNHFHPLYIKEFTRRTFTILFSRFQISIANVPNLTSTYSVFPKPWPTHRNRHDFATTVNRGRSVEQNKDIYIRYIPLSYCIYCPRKKEYHKIGNLSR